MLCHDCHFASERWLETMVSGEPMILTDNMSFRPCCRVKASMGSNPLASVRFAQRGSHVKVRRVLEGGRTQTLTVPDHDEIDRGTLQAIYRQACRFIPESELRAEFFAD